MGEERSKEYFPTLQIGQSSALVDHMKRSSPVLAMADSLTFSGKLGSSSKSFRRKVSGRTASCPRSNEVSFAESLEHDLYVPLIHPLPPIRHRSPSRSQNNLHRVLFEQLLSIRPYQLLQPSRASCTLRRCPGPRVKRRGYDDSALDFRSMVERNQRGSRAVDHARARAVSGRLEIEPS